MKAIRPISRLASLAVTSAVLMGLVSCSPKPEAQPIVPAAPPGWQVERIDGADVYRSEDDLLRVRLSTHRLLRSELTAEDLLTKISRQRDVISLHSVNPIHKMTQDGQEFAVAQLRSHRGLLLLLFVSARPDGFVQIGRLTRQGRATSDSMKTAFQIVYSSRAAAPNKNELKSPEPDLRLPHGQGIKTDQVLGLGRLNGKVWLMLRDGSAYRDPTIAPEDFNAAKSRQLEPERWIDDFAEKAKQRVLPLPAVAGSTSDCKPVPLSIKLGVAQPNWSRAGQKIPLDPLPDLGRYMEPTIPVQFSRDGTFRNASGYDAQSDAPQVSGEYKICGFALQMSYSNGKVQRMPFAAIRNNPVLGRRIY